MGAVAAQEHLGQGSGELQVAPGPTQTSRIPADLPRQQLCFGAEAAPPTDSSRAGRCLRFSR